ncbi:MAG: glycosyltransferase [Bacteroidota bacterium]|nr:glycosyltransferase [Bacteroidota bacterium]
MIYVFVCFLILILALFIVLNGMISYAIFQVFGPLHDEDKSNSIKFSVVVSAKNEKKNIAKLIKALDAQDYPKDLYEVIIVDDNSDDCTYETVLEHIKDKPNFSVIRAIDKPYPAKKGALSLGIGKAVNPFIITTDADCEPGKRWLKTFAMRFDSGYDIVFGLYSFYTTDSFVNKMSQFNHLRSSLLTFSAAYYKKPYCAGASSFAFKKESFDALHGYKNTLETLSGDDDLLIREAVKHNMKIGTVTSPSAIVYTASKETIKDYLIQKARHTTTSNYYLPIHQFFLALWHFLNIGFLFSPVLYFITPLSLLPFVVKMLTDLMTIMLHQRKFRYFFNLPEVFFFQIIYELMLIINYVNASYGRNKKWK